MHASGAQPVPNPEPRTPGRVRAPGSDSRGAREGAAAAGSGSGLSRRAPLPPRGGAPWLAGAGLPVPRGGTTFTRGGTSGGRLLRLAAALGLVSRLDPGAGGAEAAALSRPHCQCQVAENVRPRRSPPSALHLGAHAGSPLRCSGLSPGHPSLQAGFGVPESAAGRDPGHPGARPAPTSLGSSLCSSFYLLFGFAVSLV